MRKSLAKLWFVIKTASALSLRETILWLMCALACAPGAFAGNDIVSNVVTLSPAPRYTLPQCIDRALDQNLDLLVTKKHLEEAAGGIIVARAGYLPSLSTSANFEWLEANYATLNGSVSNRSDIWNINIRLTETIYSSGAVRAGLDIARLQKNSRTLDYEATVDQVIMDVRIAFYDILRNQSDIAVHEQAVNFLTEQVKNEQARLEVGTGQKLNVLRAQVNLALEQSALVDSRNRLRNSRLRLSDLLSIPYSTDQDQVPFDIDGTLAYEKTALALDDCLSRALDQRPELTARENDISVQKKQLIVDHSAVLPQVALFGGYDVVSEPDRTQSADHYEGYIGGVSVSWNVFDGFATKGRMNATRARVEAAEISRDAAYRGVKTEVLLAWRDLQRSEENIKTQTANVQLATDSQKLAAANFGLGLTSQLELLQSQLDLTRAQVTELSARFEYNVALARLDRAMGSHFQITDARQ
jgi:outer membrane protein